MNDPPSTASKRGALRFSGFQRPLTLKTEYEDGRASLVNISTSGCAINQVSISLEIHEKVLLSIELLSPRNPMEIRAVVVRSEKGHYGLEFQHIEETTKRRIVLFFVREARQHKRSSSETV